MNETERELTFGEKAVGLKFNPSKNPKVDEIKRLFARIIDIANDERVAAGPGERSRHLSVGITGIEGDQMRIVKGLTFEE